MSEIRSQATPAREVVATHGPTNQAEDLFQDFWDADLPNTQYHQDDGQGTPAVRPATRSEAAEMAVDIVQAAGWSKPRTVNSATELDALPVGSVILVDAGRYGPNAWQKHTNGRWCEASHCEESMTSTELRAGNLPATVLFTPGEAG